MTDQTKHNAATAGICLFGSALLVSIAVCLSGCVIFPDAGKVRQLESEVKKCEAVACRDPLGRYKKCDKTMEDN